MSTPNAPTRLMIREMVLENFKSYAGVQHVGPFHKSFSAVVGPNGSGKSNVIDAMLFVFGRRAKQLRFNKISELIHNSTNHRNLETARVTVHFQTIVDHEGSTEYDLVPNSSFSVTRTAHRNNQSDYYVNDRKVTTKEVTELLKGHGIDLDNNRFLILQGEVEQISMMKPKAEDKNDTGLLEYLEDIIGTHSYVQPIEESAKQLEELNEKRQGMIQRLKVVEKEKEGLEGKKQEAEDYIDKQATMYVHKYSAAQIGLVGVRAFVVDAEKKRGDLDRKLAHEKEKHQAYDRDGKEQEKVFMASEREHQALVKAYEAAEESFKGFERKDAQLQMELKHANGKLKKLVAKMEADVGNVKKLESDISSMESDIPRLQSRSSTLASDLSSAESSLETLMDEIKGEVQGYHKQLSDVRAELAPWERKMSEAGARAGVATAEREVLAKRSEDARRRLEGALKSLSLAQQSYESKSAQVKTMEASLAQCKSQLSSLHSDLEGRKKQEAKHESQASAAREKVLGLKSEVGGSGGHQGGIAALLFQAMAKKEVTGVLGRLGDLGAIDKQYDVAVSTAVGALDYIVVETASDAQKCVEFLRRGQLGVATFLILEKQKHLVSHCSEKVKTPEGAPRLYDLVKVRDESLRPAFYFAMGNTLVAQDLDQAMGIAYAKGSPFKRIVTLAGQLIAESGTLSGGGGRPSKGRMFLGAQAPKNPSLSASSSSDLKNELVAAEREMEAALRDLSSSRDATCACEGALRATERETTEIEASIPMLKMEVEAEKNKAEDLEQRLSELKKAASDSSMFSDESRRIAELDKEIAKEESKLVSLRSETAGLESRAALIQRKIDEAGGDKLKRVKASVARLQKEIADVEQEATKKGVQVKSGLKNLEKLKKDMVKDAGEKSKVEEETKSIEESLRVLEEEACAALELKQSAQVAVEANKAKLEASRAERDKFQRDFGIVRQVQANIEEQMQLLNQHIKDRSTLASKLASEVAAVQSKLKALVGDEQASTLTPSEADLEGQKADDHIYKAGMLESELQKMNPDMEAIESYHQKESDYNQRAEEVAAVTSERDECRKKYESLRKRRLDEFMSAFNIISLKLKEMYQMITLGGDAELELVDSLDPFSEGIIFSVRPPRKSWKNISNLSGGEKTLSSLSLVFALHHFKPTPLYVMDEIDAALDFKNVSIVGHYIKDRTKNAQFVIISLRNNMFELADRLVGIYKTDNSTKTVTINPAEFAVPSDGGEGAKADKDEEMTDAAPKPNPNQILPLVAVV